MYTRENVTFAIPYNEEIGFGGTYLPEGASEYLAVDIGLIGPDLEGNEHSVSICAKDNAALLLLAWRYTVATAWNELMLKA